MTMPGAPPSLAFDPDQCLAFLRAIVDPAIGCAELRILEAAYERGFLVKGPQFSRTYGGWYDDVHSLKVDAGRLRGVSGYITMNPVHRDLLCRSSNSLMKLERGLGTGMGNVVRLRWMLVDVDCERAVGISATAEELARALAARDAVLADYPELAGSSMWGCSGNGGWILVRLDDLPNDDEHKALIARVLAGLSRRYTTPLVEIDEKPKDPSRVMCLPGTVKCKGSNRPERPWRMVTLDSPEGSAGTPVDIRAFLEKVERDAPPVATAHAAGNGHAVNGHAANGHRPAAGAAGDPASLVRRASLYVARMPVAVSGEHGHDRGFDVACALIKGFGLGVGDARPIFEAWSARCVPPWSDGEIDHKLRSADEKPDAGKPRGYLADAPAGGRAEGTNGRAGADGRANGQGGADAAAPALDDICIPGTEDNPHRLARLFLQERYRKADGLALRFWRDEFHAWGRRGCYQAMSGKEIKAQLTRCLAAEFERIHVATTEAFARRMKSGKGAGGDGDAGKPPRPIAVSTRLIGDVIGALADIALLPVEDCPEQPAWLDGRDADGWPVDEVLPTKNALVHLPSVAAGTPGMLPTSPAFFGSYSLDYAFDPAAPDPVEWLKFLGQLWPDDPESVHALREWMGYLLSPDTRQQKILMMIGPKRSGRGTIARTLKALVGASNVVNPTLSTLATNFGLAPLIGKSVAIVPDARLSGRPDNAAIVERLLSISGEDDQTIDRKHLTAWTGKLPTRFVLISNELPKLRDNSGALVGRMILIRLTRTFYGQEDKTLERKLMAELPGILRWAIGGWARLRERGEFTQPESARELLTTLAGLSSPITAFVAECCVVDEAASVEKPELYNAWRSWRQSQGQDHVEEEPQFGRDLHTVIPDLKSTRPAASPGASHRPRYYVGIRLKTSLERAMDDPVAPPAPRRGDAHEPEGGDDVDFDNVVPF